MIVDKKQKEQRKTTALTTRDDGDVRKALTELSARVDEVAQSNRLGGEAQLKLVNIVFDTPEDKLPELTFILKGTVFPLSIMMMREKAINRPIDKSTGLPMSLAKIWRLAYMQLMRSIGRHQVDAGVKLAEVQQPEKEEGTGEEYELP